MPEVFTGDLPTPVKYANDAMRRCYAELETKAVEQLADRLPDGMKGQYRQLLDMSDCDGDLKRLVKAADKLSAYIKCVEEQKAGNTEFDSAAQLSMQALQNLNMPEMNWFIDNCLEPFSLNLDQL